MTVCTRLGTNCGVIACLALQVGEDDARCPFSILLRPSSEIADDPSKLARYLFRDGG